ncbi:DNA/RNA-binding domain, Est1-type [Cynara cardunculus var. scolymus]|uniref:DNA/RNA-binding domain, Est1-type n=1 Tax=Cynara cardunculus var. scolymus TaxID=59895 RepID=A0A103Y6J0_CYNCS|nr:DNA/RNA-binding domain, Est1-type [Cynara cardunculus var. scolymus]
MTVPMNNTLGNSSRERAQLLYNKNVELESKRRKAAQVKIPSDPNAWQQMRENYESILLEDHAFSEQHDIEYALWQLHYKRIEELRAHYSAAQASAAQNGKGLYGEGDSKTRDFAAASSYYKQAATLWPSSGNPHHQLAILASYSGDELLAVYRYFRSLVVDTPFTTARDNLIIAFEKCTRATYISEFDWFSRCLICEDIIVIKVPISHGRELSEGWDVFAENRQSYCQLLGDTKAAPTKKAPARMTGKGRNKGETRVSLKDRKTEPSLVEEREPTVPDALKAFSIRFVRLNGILFTRTSLETFGEVFSLARNDFLQLLSSGRDEVFSFGSDFGDCKLFITRFIAIMIFTVYNVNKDAENQSYAEILQRSVVLQNAFAAIFDFMALIVERILPLPMKWRRNRRQLDPCDGGNKEKKARVQRIVAAGKALTIGVRVGQQGICFDSKSKRFFFGVEQHNADNVLLGSSKEISATNSMGQENHLRSPLQPHGEGEEEDEVIVFKPSVTEKHMDGFPSKLMSSEVIGNGANSSKVASRSNGVSVPISHGGFPLEQPASSVNGNMQYLQLAQTNTSTWMAGGEEFIENGLSSLNLLGTGFPTRSEKERSSGMLQSTSLSVAPPQSVGFGSCLEHSFQDPATVIPSKFDSVMTSAPSFDSIPSKTKSIKPGGWNKSPVSRPIRHFGPPPGFNTSAPKYTDESLRHENPPMDDYSWLDGYQLPYSAYGDGFGNSFNCLPQPNKLLNTNKASLGMECFPFPGKQVSTVQVDIGKQNGWLDYQIPEHSSLYQEPLQQLKKGFEQSTKVDVQWPGTTSSAITYAMWLMFKAFNGAWMVLDYCRHLLLNRAGCLFVDAGAEFSRLDESEKKGRK